MIRPRLPRCARIGLLALPLLMGWTQLASAQTRGVNNAGRGQGASTTKPLFKSPAKNDREASIQAAIDELKRLAKTLPKNDPRRKDLEDTASGLERMKAGGRFRTKPRDKMKNPGAKAETEVPGVEVKPDDKPKGEKKPRDPVEDSWIDFPEEDWQEEAGDPPVPTDSDYKGGNKAELAIILWHEWQHAKDGPLTDCEEIKRHICIYKAQQKLSKLMGDTFGDPTGENYDPAYGQMKRRNLLAENGAILRLIAECKKKNCGDCGECEGSSPWLPKNN